MHDSTAWLEAEIDRLTAQIIENDRAIEKRDDEIAWYENENERLERERDEYQRTLDNREEIAQRAYTQWSQIGGYP